MGTNQGQIESLILNLANHPEPEVLIDVAIQATPLSKTESIALERIANQIKQQQEEKRILEEEIKQASTILERKNANTQTIYAAKRRLAEDRQILGLLQQARSIGIEIEKLLPFSLAVNEKAQTCNLSISAAAYRVIEDV